MSNDFVNNELEQKLQKALEESSTFTTIVNEEIATSTGAMLTNESDNKLFIWQFDEIDIKSLVSYFETIFINGVMNRAKLKKIKTDLISLGKDIEKNNVYPVEAILYASKMINNRLGDLALKECLAEVIEYFLKQDERKGEKVLRHIFKNWTWTNQQKIAILASRALNNLEVLYLVYDEFHDINELKYECFATLLNSKNEEVLEMLLNMVCNLNNEYEVDRQIGKLFLAKFEEKFLSSGVKYVQEVKDLKPHITFFAKKILDKIEPSEIENTSNMGGEMSDFIRTAKLGVKNNEDYFINYFSSNKGNRRNIILSLRYAMDKDYAAEFLLKKYDEFKTKLNNEEVKTTILTLALLGSEKSIEISRRYKENAFKPYEWASMIILGDNVPMDSLCEDYFNNDYGFDNDYKNIMRACVSRRPNIVEKIERKFQEVIKKSNETEFCEYLKIAKNFIREHKSVSMRQSLISMVTEKDNSQYLRIIESEKMQNAIINSIGDLVNEDTIKVYQNVLFEIASNPDFLTRIKVKANSILKDYINPGELDG
ncbi:MAG: hypothetical protein MR274_02915 [Clostridium sp.]|nr:hypothetical protein [Clostridium sp.]